MVTVSREACAVPTCNMRVDSNRGEHLMLLQQTLQMTSCSNADIQVLRCSGRRDVFIQSAELDV